jgi:pimeloyl-ACP methyl ester carboxylesterase
MVGGMGGRNGSGNNSLWPFLGGVLAGAAGAVVAQAYLSRRRLDPSLLGAIRHHPDTPPVVIVPGILGSELVGADGRRLWLNLRNALGHHDLSLPFAPVVGAAEDLRPGGLVGIGTMLPRVFGFTEYADLLDLLASAGFHRHGRVGPRTCHVFTYDWRRDLAATARLLGQRLDALADQAGDPDLRVNVIGHSMGGLVARHYLRYGGEPGDGPVTWAGTRRIRSLVLVATPNEGSIAALDAILNGSRVGLSYTTLAASVVARMPSIYQLLPPRAAVPLVDGRGEPLGLDLHDPETWKALLGGPKRPAGARRRRDDPVGGDRDAEAAFLERALLGARAFHEALARPPESECPARVLLLGGDCLPTPARAVVAEAGAPPRFEPLSRAEAEWMMEAGDGRVTRASALGVHLPGADHSETGSGIPEIGQAFFGDAEHHGIYAEPTFQSLLLRLLLRRPRTDAARLASHVALG